MNVTLNEEFAISYLKKKFNTDIEFISWVITSDGSEKISRIEIKYKEKGSTLVYSHTIDINSIFKHKRSEKLNHINEMG